MKPRSPHRYATKHQRRKLKDHLTVIVAASVLAVVMGSVSRLSVAALANSSNQAERVRIEAAINDNIQLLQMADFYLRLKIWGQDERIAPVKIQQHYSLNTSARSTTALRRRIHHKH